MAEQCFHMLRRCSELMKLTGMGDETMKETTRTFHTATRIMRLRTLAFTIFIFIAGVKIGSAQAQSYTVLHSFVHADGTGPESALIRDGKGNLYGTTASDGAYGYATIFKLDAAGALTVLYSFTERALPSGVIRDAAGSLYGTTYNGGDTTCFFGCGTIFKLDSAGTVTVLHNFTSADGVWPPSRAGLVRDSTGSLYGVTSSGGDLPCFLNDGCGTLFKLTADGSLIVLHRFSGGEDGANPVNVMLDANANLYGTTVSGGDFDCAPNNGCGTVFKFDSAGRFTTLHTFSSSDGVDAEGRLVRDPKGNLYGTTVAGGLYGAGTVFKLDPSGTITVLHNFSDVDGGPPGYAGLVQDASGVLYGTNAGWKKSLGTVFKLDPVTTRFRVLHRFLRKSGEGYFPLAGLAPDGSGYLVGTTVYGGSFSCDTKYGCGTIFRISGR